MTSGRETDHPQEISVNQEHSGGSTMDSANASTKDKVSTKQCVGKLPNVKNLQVLHVIDIPDQ